MWSPRRSPGQAPPATPSGYPSPTPTSRSSSRRTTNSDIPQNQSSSLEPSKVGDLYLWTLGIEHENEGNASPLNDGSGGEFTASQLPLIPIIGALVCVLLICILLIDLSCYKINKTGKYGLSFFLISNSWFVLTGVTYFLCEKTKYFKKFNAQSER